MITFTEALHKIANHRSSLTREEARSVMGEVLQGKASDAQIAALLVSLHMKGETVEEIVGFAEAIRAAASEFDSGKRLDETDSTSPAPNATLSSIPAARAATPAAHLISPQPRH